VGGKCVQASGAKQEKNREKNWTGGFPFGRVVIGGRLGETEYLGDEF